jgi:hypothetical protein
VPQTGHSHRLPIPSSTVPLPLKELSTLLPASLLPTHHPLCPYHLTDRLQPAGRLRHTPPCGSDTQIPTPLAPPLSQAKLTRRATQLHDQLLARCLYPNWIMNSPAFSWTEYPDACQSGGMDTKDGGWVERRRREGWRALRVRAETVPLVRGRSRVG